MLTAKTGKKEKETVVLLKVFKKIIWVFRTRTSEKKYLCTV